jgi:hypothetical protein
MDVRYLVHSLMTYPILETVRKSEMEVMSRMLQGNESHSHNINAVRRKIERRTQKIK